MALYTIGDLHLSLSGDKPMDVFKGWENYIEILKENWNLNVSNQDTVVIVGDISWAMQLSEAYLDFEYIHQLNGMKILLKGNHDYWFSTKNKIQQYFNDNQFDTLHILHNNCYVYEDHVLCGTRGWIHEQTDLADKKVLHREVGRLRYSLEAGKKTGKKPLAFLHYPPIYEHCICEEIMKVLYDFKVEQCFYGHIHGEATRYAINGKQGGIEFRLVSNDFVNFCPVQIL